MDLDKVEKCLQKWQEIVHEENAYNHLQQQALIRDIHLSFNLAEILYLLTLVPQHLAKSNQASLMAQYQRFTIDLISTFSISDLEKYQELVRECNLYLAGTGCIEPSVYEQKLHEIEESSRLSKVAKIIRKKLKK